MQVDLAQDWDESSGFLGLATLLTFDWLVAVGDRELSADQFALLEKQAGRVVRFHDKFMYVDEKGLYKLRNKLARQEQDYNKMAELRAELTGDIAK